MNTRETLPETNLTALTMLSPTFAYAPVSRALKSRIDVKFLMYPLLAITVGLIKRYRNGLLQFVGALVPKSKCLPKLGVADIFENTTGYSLCAAAECFPPYANIQNPKLHSVNLDRVDQPVRLRTISYSVIIPLPGHLPPQTPPAASTHTHYTSSHEPSNLSEILKRTGNQSKI